jgi:hypothetical protein
VIGAAAGDRHVIAAGTHGDHSDRGDQAVGDLDEPIDLGAGAEGPRDGGASDGVVGEHDGRAAVD